jgi:hypothetical protein
MEAKMKHKFLIPAARGRAYVYRHDMNGGGGYIPRAYAKPGMFFASRYALSYSGIVHMSMVTRHEVDGGRVQALSSNAMLARRYKGIFLASDVGGSDLSNYDRSERKVSYWGDAMVWLIGVQNCMFNQGGAMPRGIIARRAGYYSESFTLSHAWVLDPDDKSYYKTICHTQPSIGSDEYIMLHPGVECGHCRRKIDNGLNISGFLDAKDWF